MEHLDLGCGIGVPGRLMAAVYPNSHFYGLDTSQSSIKEAKKEAENQDLSNVHFQTGDAAYLPVEWSIFEGKFDWITAFNSVHDMPYPQKVLHECFKVLKKGAYLSVIDFDCHSNANYNKWIPNATSLYTISLFHCMTVSLSQEGGTGLGTMWGVELASEMIKQAGFTDIKIQRIPHSFNCHILARKPEE